MFLFSHLFSDIHFHTKCVLIKNILFYFKRYVALIGWLSRALIAVRICSNHFHLLQSTRTNSSYAACSFYKNVNVHVYRSLLSMVPSSISVMVIIIGSKWLNISSNVTLSQQSPLPTSVARGVLINSSKFKQENSILQKKNYWEPRIKTFHARLFVSDPKCVWQSIY